MENTIIGIKELRKNLPKIAKAAHAGKRYTVFRYAKPYFTIAPPQMSRAKKEDAGDLFGMRFRAKDKNLSKHIDRIVYGV